MDRMWDFFERHERKVIGASLFFFLALISFEYRQGAFRFIIFDFPTLVFLLAFLSCVSVIILIQIQRQRIRRLTEHLRLRESADQSSNNQNVQKLTKRQQEVFQLIQQGMSNKEIQAALHIGQSTLKTHINQIYKELGISGRKDVR